AITAQDQYPTHRWQELCLLRKELDKPDFAACLSPSEQQRYQRVMDVYSDVAAYRERNLSVLEWLVFLEDAVQRVPKETESRYIGSHMGVDSIQVDIDPSDRVRNGATFDTWTTFWKKTQYIMASALELATAEISIYNILLSAPELYSAEELAQVRKVQQRIVDEIAKTPEGLVLETYILFEKDKDTAAVQHHASTKFVMSFQNVELPEMDRSIGEVNGHICSRLFGETFFPYSMLKVRQHCKDIALIMPEQEKRKGSTSPVLRVRMPFPSNLYVIEPVESKAGSFTSIGIDRTIYDKYHGNKQ
ncbi:hypothetical protein HYS47_05435, partial [Candidatus Woesearchaeota archaeon]|nr:hypothetical protein [Candidatus Woesearchaeota archaeon]